ncbi:MAG: transposase [Saprospiraceae bacterium]|nr:transposase [Saprospiraceae bacterium]
MKRYIQIIKINLITDIVVVKNNVSDDKILEQRIPELKQKTPQLNEYFADSAYANENIDKLNKEHGIKQFQNGVKGRKSDANLRINRKGESYTVSCAGGQVVEATKTEKNYKVVFDPEKCKNCPIKDLCKLKAKGGKKIESKRYYYFEIKNILAHERIQNIEKLTPELRNSRCNVEATVKELKRGMRNGKVRVKQWIRVSFHMVFTAISVNLRRIHLKNDKNDFITGLNVIYIIMYVDCKKSKLNILMNFKYHVIKFQRNTRVNSVF